MSSLAQKYIQNSQAAPREVFFYQHTYLRDRHLDTVRRWGEQSCSSDIVLNKAHFAPKSGAQVSSKKALAANSGRSWKQRLPLINLKRRPPQVSKDTVVYLWGGMLSHGPHIIDLDNPLGLTGFNVDAMKLYRRVIRCLLLRKSCLEIRCLSAACRDTTAQLFGKEVANKCVVHYPYMPQHVDPRDLSCEGDVAFLFVGTQFEIKGGFELLSAFRRAHEVNRNMRLDVITHLPDSARKLAEHPKINVYAPNFSRGEIGERFMRRSHVLVHPSYIESFGMVILEALSYGLAVVAADVYAVSEMIQDGKSGVLVQPPVSIWDGTLPSPHFRRWHRFKEVIRNTDSTNYEEQLFRAINMVANSRTEVLQLRRNSLELFEKKFASL